MPDDHTELVFPDALQPQQTDQQKPSLPLPGPSSAWTAAGVIAALENMALEKRRERLKAVLKSRMNAVTVVFENPHKPHNGSAVLRSCEAFGVQRAHMIRKKEMFGDSKFSISKLISKGSHQWIDIVEHRTCQSVLNELKASGHTLLVTHPEGHLQPEDLHKIDKVALILGNEREGVGSELTAAAHDTVAIPMRGFVESLNVSVTAAILLQAATQGRSGDLSEAEMENIYARWLRKTVPRADEVLRSFSPC